MAAAVWADVAGDLEALVALSLPATRADAGRVYLALRHSLYARVALMFADPLCDAATRELARKFVTGRGASATG